MGEMNEPIGKVILQNGMGNCQMTSPSIQNDIISCFAQEVVKQIFEELGDEVFSLLVYESTDVSNIEQMAVVLRYVDKFGLVKERFIGLVHVTERTALSLKNGIDGLLAKYNLSVTKIRGLGYDGASNMAGEFNGLKALILKENSSAYFMHCFAHQLQLVVVTLATKHNGIWNFFKEVATLTNVVCGSCKRIDLIRENQKKMVQEQIGCEEIETESGLNQEFAVARVGDTRSHHLTLVRLAQLYPIVIEVLEYIHKSGSQNVNQRRADLIQEYMKTFDFVYLHLMKHILGVTNTLSQSLQKKDQDIVNTVGKIKTTKQDLQTYRLEGFGPLMLEVKSFCEKYDIDLVDMDAEYVNPKYKRKKTSITNRHYYEFDNFNTVLDMQIQEFGNRFNEVTTELLTCICCLTPDDKFSAFDIQKLLKLAEMYPYDFTHKEREQLMHELKNYITVIREDKLFSNLNGISNLAKKVVETNKQT